MPSLNTASVAIHVAPNALVAFVAHFLRVRKKKKQGITISYAEGLAIVKRFLSFASTHTVAELQTFTANRVPTPSWVYKLVEPVPTSCISQAADHLRRYLSIDPKTLELVGGVKWWTMRGRDLTGEWIEMKKDRLKRGGKPPTAVLLYTHGGAHYFSSLETHRYQIQRHARKLNAIAFAPSYRLAPQYPFPCGLHDVLASYLFLFQSFEPSQILLSGDSSGGGLTLSLLVLLRDLGLPMPAGATLISPWCDLAHSFPSIMGDDAGDYIPNVGFHFRAGLEWPPLPDDGIEVVLEGETEKTTLVDQMQMYCPNSMLDHPMVSPVNQGSLGGLPPLYIVAGEAELLRDEIIYVAHKAADPAAYPPSTKTLAVYPSQAANLKKYHAPTLVQLQVSDLGCHVATTLSITNIAKHQYRGCANFGLWALTAAKKKLEREANGPSPSSIRHHHHHHHHHQHDSSATSHASTSLHSTTSSSSAATSTEIAPVLDPIDAERANAETHSLDTDSEHSSDNESCCSSDYEDEPDDDDGTEATLATTVKVTGHIPTFHNSMIRQRVSVSGRIRELEPASELPACTVSPESVGRLHTGPVRRWLKERSKYDTKYSKDHNKYREIRRLDRQKAEASGYLLGEFEGERPPLASLAAWSDQKHALKAGESVDEKVKDVNMALAMWAKVSAAPDEEQAGMTKVEEVKVKEKVEGAKEV